MIKNKVIPVSYTHLDVYKRQEEARALIMAEFDNYIYCCTHLSLTEEDRMASLELINDFAAAHKMCIRDSSQIQSLERTMFFNGLDGIFRTGRYKTA